MGHDKRLNEMEITHDEYMRNRRVIPADEFIDLIKSHLNEITLFDDDYGDGYKMACENIIEIIENFD